MFREDESEDFTHSEDSSEDLVLLKEAEKLLKISNYMKACFNVSNKTNVFKMVR